MDIKNNIFWHICGLNNWKNVVLDQYSTIISSGLINKIENIYITFLGETSDDISWLLDKNNKLILHNYSNNYNLYEKLCLDSLREWSLNNESNILYIHTKGISHPDNINVWNWRKMMEYFLVNQYQKCINLLSRYDTIGCMLLNKGKAVRVRNEKHNYHFSGNFWWTKTDYVKTLPPIPDIDMSVDNNSWLCERWILYHYPKIKIFIPFQGKLEWYYNESPVY